MKQQNTKGAKDSSGSNAGKMNQNPNQPTAAHPNKSTTQNNPNKQQSPWAQQGGNQPGGKTK